MSINQKILDIQQAIDNVPKNGYNDFNKYPYVLEKDVMEAVKKASKDTGLVITTSIADYTTGTFEAPDKNGVLKVTRFAHVNLQASVADIESGDVSVSYWPGYAEDSGDKAVYKAMTGATKYFYMKFFQVPTGDDPENEVAAPQPSRPTGVPNQAQMSQAQFLEAVAKFPLDPGIVAGVVKRDYGASEPKYVKKEKYAECLKQLSLEVDKQTA